MLQQLQGARFALAQRIRVVEVHDQRDVLDQGERRQQLKELKDHAQIQAAPAGALIFVQVLNGCAIDDDLAGGGAIDAGD